MYYFVYKITIEYHYNFIYSRLLRISCILQILHFLWLTKFQVQTSSEIFLCRTCNVKTEESEIYHLKRGFDFNGGYKTLNFLLQICKKHFKVHKLEGKKCIEYFQIHKRCLFTKSS